MHLSPEARVHRSPTCVTQAPVLHIEVPQSVLQAASYTDLDFLDCSAQPCLLCDIFRFEGALRRTLLVTYFLFEMQFEAVEEAKSRREIGIKTGREHRS